jgi:hypothetical protein
MQLAMIEYFELLFYRDRARSAVMFPKVGPFGVRSDVVTLTNLPAEGHVLFD